MKQRETSRHIAIKEGKTRMIIITINKKKMLLYIIQTTTKYTPNKLKKRNKKKTVRMELHFFLDEGGVVKL